MSAVQTTGLEAEDEEEDDDEDILTKIIEMNESSK
jgi:hypothetical protein